MNIYLVGGAVRDFVLGREIKDRDFVVVGATEQEMLDLGFKKVGADFPVFLHPVSGEEFALARRERKAGHGYNGFEVQFDPSVTLEDDLIRRDLTMNAMAVPVVEMDEAGVPVVDFDAIIDPYNGRDDINNGVLRHVSEAFAEDPVRVLRVARFAARYNFVPARATIELMKHLVDSGELDHLVPERVWSETERALGEDSPISFFATLAMCGADQKLFPEVTLDNRVEFNLVSSSKLDVRSRFALLTLDFKADDIEPFCERLRVPVDFMRLAQRANTLRSCLGFPVTGESAVTTLEMIGAFQQTDEALAAIEVCRSSIDGLGESFARRLRRVSNVLPLVTPVRFGHLTTDQQRTLRGPEIGRALRALRVNIVTQYLWREGLGLEGSARHQEAS